MLYKVSQCNAIISGSSRSNLWGAPRLWRGGRGEEAGVIGALQRREPRRARVARRPGCWVLKQRRGCPGARPPVPSRARKRDSASSEMELREKRRRRRRAQAPRRSPRPDEPPAAEDQRRLRRRPAAAALAAGGVDRAPPSHGLCGASARARGRAGAVARCEGLAASGRPCDDGAPPTSDMPSASGHSLAASRGEAFVRRRARALVLGGKRASRNASLSCRLPRRLRRGPFRLFTPRATPLLLARSWTAASRAEAASSTSCRARSRAAAARPPARADAAFSAAFSASALYALSADCAASSRSLSRASRAPRRYALNGLSVCRAASRSAEEPPAAPSSP